MFDKALNRRLSRNKELNFNRRVFVFSGPRPSPWPLICIYRPWPPICVYRSWPPICIYRPWPPICIWHPWLPICIYRLWSIRSLGLYNLVPPICIYWSLPTIIITVLWICIYLLFYSSSSGSNNISHSSNFLGLDNTNITMAVLVN